MAKLNVIIADRKDGSSVTLYYDMSDLDQVRYKADLAQFQTLTHLDKLYTGTVEEMSHNG